MRGAASGLLGAACLTYLGFVLPMQAQDLDAEKLKKFIFSDLHQHLVARAFSQMSPDVFQRCPTLVSKGSNVRVIQPVSFGASGVPNAGMWQESFPISGCGNDTTFHAYFSATKDEKINIAFGAPGESRADLTLQRDAFTHAALGAGAAAKTCKTFNAKDTKFNGLESANNKIQSWRETWTMVGCGRTFDVRLTFSPNDRGGTTISQSLGAAVERR